MTYPNVYATQTGPLALSSLDANFLYAVDIANGALSATAGGTADAITATYSPAPAALVAGLTLYLRAASANATTTPQFSPNGLTGKVIVKNNNQALAVGDIAGAGHWLHLVYDATNGVWELINPATSASVVLTGGTANGVAYLNASKVLTTGTALTFDGTNFATTGTATATKLIPTGTSVTGNGLYLPAANALGLSTNGTNAVYIDSSQNVGIGTSSPSYKLNVVSTSSSGVNTGVFSNANNSLFIRNGGSTIVYLTSDSSVNNAWGMDSTSNYVAAYTSTGAERMRIDSSGNVLVGTTVNNVYDSVATARPLVVQKSDTSTTINGSTASITIVNGDTTTSNTAQLNFAAITGASTSQYSSAVISTIFGARTNGQYPTGILTFSTSTSLNASPSEKMRIDSSGNVLVGTTSASTPSTTGYISVANTFGFKNRIINGGMALDQRNAGASQTITAAAALAYTVDRWYAYCTGANVTGQQIAGAYTSSQYRYQFTGAASVTAIGFGQRIEAKNCFDLANTTATLSCYISNSLLTTVTWTAYYATTTADTFGSLASPTVTQIATGTFTVSSTRTQYTTNISIPSAATTGIQILFTVGAQTSGTWAIDSVQLEKGSTATSFDYRDYGRELIMCQRYFIAFTNTVFGGINNRIATGSGVSATLVRLLFPFPVAMRSAPSATMSGTPRAEAGSAISITSASSAGMNTYGAGLDCSAASGLTTGTAYSMDTGSGGYSFSSEL